MKTHTWMSFAVLSIAVAVISGCKPSEPPPAPETPPTAPLANAETPAAPTMPAGELPPGHPPIGEPKKDPALPEGHPPMGAPGMGEGGLPTGHPPIKAPGTGDEETAVVPIEAPTQFAGISLTPPAGWQAVDPGKGMMVPVAAFLLPRAEGDDADGSARLTHFPGMRNIPLDQNLDRWYGMVTQPDGSSTKEKAVLDSFEAGGVKHTVVDMSGTVSGNENWRLVAVVIEHPQGPHFLKAAGPEATVAKWRASIDAYLRSSKIAE